jgi:hypothetical protein
MFKEQDTSWLQLESIIKCANSLRYEFDGRAFYTYIYKDSKYKKYYISFSDMQKIHNDEVCYQVGSTLVPKWNFLKSSYIKVSKGSKLVKKATLQWHKKKKQFIAQNNMVKFA